MLKAVFLVGLCGSFAFAEDAVNADKVIAKLQLLGARIEREDDRPDGPIVGITFAPGSRFNDHFVYQLKNFPDLKRLDLLHASISDAGVKELSGLESLEELKLSGRHVSDRSVAELAKLLNLTELTLFATYLTERGMDSLCKSLPKLRIRDEWQLYKKVRATYGDSISTDAVAGGPIFNLKFGGNIPDEAMKELRPFRDLPSLHRIEFSNCQLITDEGILEFAHFKDLQTIVISGCPKVSGECLTAFKDHPNLFDLTVSSEQFDDNDLAAIAQIERLTSLSIRGSRMTDRGFQEIGRLRKLKSLVLGGMEITVAGVAVLKELPDLYDLKIVSCPKINDEAMNEIGDLASLNNLFLANLEITDEGLEPILKLESLEHLRLMNCNKVSDAGVDPLRQLHKLEYLSLFGSRFKQQGTIELKKVDVKR